MENSQIGRFAMYDTFRMLGVLLPALAMMGCAGVQTTEEEGSAKEPYTTTVYTAEEFATIKLPLPRECSLWVTLPTNDDVIPEITVVHYATIGLNGERRLLVYSKIADQPAALTKQVGRIGNLWNLEEDKAAQALFQEGVGVVLKLTEEAQGQVSDHHTLEGWYDATFKKVLPHYAEGTFGLLCPRQ